MILGGGLDHVNWDFVTPQARSYRNHSVDGSDRLRSPDRLHKHPNIIVERPLEREREIGVGTALGAGSWRVMSQFLIESSLMAVAGGGLGLLISLWIVGLFESFPSLIARGFDFSVDAIIIGFAMAISFFTALFAGHAPAFMHRRPSLTFLEQGSVCSGTNSSCQRVRRTLVVAEVALTPD